MNIIVIYSEYPYIRLFTFYQGNESKRDVLPLFWKDMKEPITYPNKYMMLYKTQNTSEWRSGSGNNVLPFICEYGKNLCIFFCKYITK